MSCPLRGASAVLIGPGKGDEHSYKPAPEQRRVDHSRLNYEIDRYCAAWKELEDYKKAASLAFQGDKVAVNKLVVAGLLTGSLRELNAGDKVFLCDTSFWSGAVEIRLEGELTTWWTEMENLKE